MTTAHFPIRLACASLLLALLGIRLLSPAGFMPEFDRGAVTIVACPDAAPAMPMPAHSKHHRGTVHEICPYAAAAAAAASPPESAPVASQLLFFPAPAAGPAFLFVARSASREPPRLRGPPIPA
ncbi:MAG: hypothetical protein ACTHN4_06860 [Sphingomicrobium sp.]